MEQRFHNSCIQSSKSVVHFHAGARLSLFKETNHVFCFAWKGRGKLSARPVANVLGGFDMRLSAIVRPACTGRSLGAGAATGSSPSPSQAAGNSLTGLFQIVLGFSSPHPTLLAEGIGATGFWQLAAHRFAHARWKDLSLD
jgi:hypothetical protein